MAGNTSDISMASNALLLLGGKQLTSFTDGSTESKIANALYKSSYEGLLTSYRWRFATKKAKLARLAEAPKNEYSYKYQLPSDLLYLTRMVESEDYEVYGDALYCNITECSIDYTFKVKEDKLPPYFIKTLEFFLAMQFAIPLTGDLDKMKTYEKLYSDYLNKAMFADATQRPQSTFDDNPYLDVRGG